VVAFFGFRNTHNWYYVKSCSKECEPTDENVYFQKVHQSKCIPRSFYGDETRVTQFRPSDSVIPGRNLAPYGYKLAPHTDF